MSTEQQQTKAPQDIVNVVRYLRSSKSGIKIRVGALNGKRIDYFKGKSAIKALLSPAYAKLKNVPPVSNEADAARVLASALPYVFFLLVERGAPSGASSSSPKTLTVVPVQRFDASPTAYYAWLYAGSQWTTYAGGAGMVALLLAGVMFPLWPPIMRLGVWYLSMAMLGLIGLFFGIAIVRLIFYVITVIVASPGIWIFPKLFADVGFVESFIPLWEWDLPKKKSKKGKGKAASVEKKLASNGGAFIEEVEVDSGVDSSRPGSRAARVEEVPEES